jgi:hypothetical protein
LVLPHGNQPSHGENKMSDPFYGQIDGPNGKIAGAAAFMHLVKNSGGPSKMIRDIATIAGAAGGQRVLDSLDARAVKQPPLRLVKNS